MCPMMVIPVSCVSVGIKIQIIFNSEGLQKIIMTYLYFLGCGCLSIEKDLGCLPFTSIDTCQTKSFGTIPGV